MLQSEEVCSTQHSAWHCYVTMARRYAAPKATLSLASRGFFIQIPKFQHTATSYQVTHSPDIVAVALFSAVFCGCILFALFAKSRWSSQVHLVHQLLYRKNERLVSKEMVMHQWGSFA